MWMVIETVVKPELPLDKAFRFANQRWLRFNPRNGRLSKGAFDEALYHFADLHTPTSVDDQVGEYLLYLHEILMEKSAKSHPLNWNPSRPTTCPAVPLESRPKLKKTQTYGSIQGFITFVNSDRPSSSTTPHSSDRKPRRLYQDIYYQAPLRRVSNCSFPMQSRPAPLERPITAPAPPHATSIMVLVYHKRRFHFNGRGADSARTSPMNRSYSGFAQIQTNDPNPVATKPQKSKVLNLWESHKDNGDLPAQKNSKIPIRPQSRPISRSEFRNQTKPRPTKESLKGLGIFTGKHAPKTKPHGDEILKDETAKDNSSDLPNLDTEEVDLAVYARGYNLRQNDGPIKSHAGNFWLHERPQDLRAARILNYVRGVYNSEQRLNLQETAIGLEIGYI
ncbi:hypothetical protein AAMO2058_001221900 [Amorphochlora amoebiformis]